MRVGLGILLLTIGVLLPQAAARSFVAQDAPKPPVAAPEAPKDSPAPPPTDPARPTDPAKPVDPAKPPVAEAPAQAPPPAEDQPPVEPAEIVKLFNGTDLAGLYTWLNDAKYGDPRAVFAVKDGQLRISGDGYGFIGTRKSYRNYRVVVEYRWGERNWGRRVGLARDSGLFLHTRGPDGNTFDGNGAYRAGLECNIMEGATGDLLLIRGRDAKGEYHPLTLTGEGAAERDGAGWAYWQRGGKPVEIKNWGMFNWKDKDRQWKDAWGFRGPRDVEAKLGQWNTLECISQGDRITVKLNGIVINEAAGLWPTDGRLLLQCEGSEIFYRKWELHPLPKAAEPPTPPANPLTPANPATPVNPETPTPANPDKPTDPAPPAPPKAPA